MEATQNGPNKFGFVQLFMKGKKEDSSGKLLSVLARPSYLNFSGSVILSQFAFNTLNLTLVFIIFNITQSTTPVALLIFVFMIPQVFLSFLGGVLADIENKKTILVVGNIVRALLMMVLFFFHNSVSAIYMSAFLIAIATHFYVPAEAPYIPYLVKRNQLLSANSIFGITFFGSVLLGYIGAGPLVQLFGPKYVFLIILGIFLSASFLASFLPHAKNERDLTYYKNGNIVEMFFRLVASEFIDSLKTIYRAGTSTVGSFVLLAVSQVIIFILATIIPEYANSVLSLSTEQISLTLFAPAALGMISSSLIIGTFLKRIKKENLIIFGIFLSALVLIGFPLLSILPSSDRVYFAMLLAFLAGFSNANIFVPSQTIIHESIPDSHRSKISGLLFALIGLLSFVPIITAGVITDIMGVNFTLFILGMMVIGVGLGRISLSSLFIDQIIRKILNKA